MRMNALDTDDVPAREHRVATFGRLFVSRAAKSPAATSFSTRRRRWQISNLEHDQIAQRVTASQAVETCVDILKLESFADQFVYRQLPRPIERDVARNISCRNA